MLKRSRRSWLSQGSVRATPPPRSLPQRVPLGLEAEIALGVASTGLASIGGKGGSIGRSMSRYSHRVDADPLSTLNRYLAERSQSPFGELELASGHTAQRFSVAGQQAASNLLVKASRALDGDETERARAYVDRAVRLPYDEHEQSHPVAMEVHMMLFCLVTDVLENADEDDSRWLDAAIRAQTAADEAGRCTMRDVLVAIDNDYRLKGAERASLRSAIAAVPDRPELSDLDLGPGELGEHVMSVLAVCRDYRVALSDPP